MTEYIVTSDGMIIGGKVKGELVRCKDCQWWHESETHKGYGDCGQANGITLKPSNWYCADGERKEGR